MGTWLEIDFSPNILFSFAFTANFILQFLVLSLLVGIPLFTFHSSLGQLLGAGVMDMWRISPIFKVSPFYPSNGTPWTITSQLCTWGVRISVKRQSNVLFAAAINIHKRWSKTCQRRLSAYMLLLIVMFYYLWKVILYVSDYRGSASHCSWPRRSLAHTPWLASRGCSHIFAIRSSRNKTFTVGQNRSTSTKKVTI